MKSNYEFVREWTEAMGEGVPMHPSSLSYELAQRRERLMSEELDELCEELYEQDMASTVKELCDLLWVVYGTAISLGVTEDKLRHCMSEVYRSNMSKFGPDGKPVRHADGKIAKGPNFSPADISGILFA